MTRTTRLVVTVLVLGLALFAAGCKKPAPVTPPEVAAPAPQTTPPEPQEPPPAKPDTGAGWDTTTVETGTMTPEWIQKMNDSGVLKTVYFGFDSYDLDSPARTVIQANATWLQDVGKQADIRVEGHCDERGTIEYNLALGERRASAVREYLVSLGVDASRVRIVSFGEEQPADPGHTEAGWAKNRRAVFVIEAS